MFNWASTLGFLIGAAAGTIASATTWVDLQEQAAAWGNRSADAHSSSGGLPLWRRAVRALLNLSSLTALIALLIGWLGALVAIECLTAPWSHRTTAFIAGSLVGVAAAPWIWLHFYIPRPKAAHRDVAEAEAPADPLLTPDLARYRLLTIVLAGALVFAAIYPNLPDWSRRAEKVEAFGLSLSFSQSRTERGSTVPDVGGQQRPPGGSPGSLGATVARLASATSSAHQAANGNKQLRDIKADLKGFTQLSVIDRDRVYIAFMTFEGTFLRRAVELAQKTETLEAYVQLAETFSPPGNDNGRNDTEFLRSISGFTGCLSDYAKTLRDFHLFFVDSASFMRHLVLSVSRWRAKDRAGSFSTNEFKDKVKNLTNQISETLEGTAASQSCKAEQSLIAPDKVFSDLGKTPYPVYLTAFYMAAIDSVESGVVMLSEWLQEHAPAKGSAEANDPQLGWYIVRAMLASSQLPYAFGTVAPTHRSLVRFQEETTDRMGRLLRVGDAPSWRAFCKKIEPDNIHAHVGRYLAVTYADERNYLFELLQPQDFGLPRPEDSSLKATEATPVSYLDEAEAILAAPECLAGVPRFEDDRDKLIAQYHLNAAQLKYARRLGSAPGERAGLTRDIRESLDYAAELAKDSRLGDSRGSGRAEVLNLLRQPDQFESHRERLVRLRKTLDRETENE